MGGKSNRGEYRVSDPVLNGRSRSVLLDTTFWFGSPLNQQLSKQASLPSASDSRRNSHLCDYSVELAWLVTHCACRSRNVESYLDEFLLRSLPFVRSYNGCLPGHPFPQILLRATHVTANVHGTAEKHVLLRKNHEIRDCKQLSTNPLVAS